MSNLPNILGIGPNVAQDAAAAALFTACKIEDTLKKSRDIVCAAYNLKLPPSEHLSSDSPVCRNSPKVESLGNDG